MQMMIKKYSIVITCCLMVSFLAIDIEGSRPPSRKPIHPQRRPLPARPIPRPHPIARPPQKPVQPVQQPQPKAPETIDQMLARQDNLQQEISNKETRIEELLGASVQAATLEQDIFKLMDEKTDLEKQLDQVSAQIEHAFGAIKAEESKVEEKPKTIETEGVKGGIEGIVKAHSQSVGWDCQLLVRTLSPDEKSEITAFKKVSESKEIEGGMARVTQLGALCQKRSVNDFNNYCGYYAAYNLRCFLEGKENIQAQLCDRKIFSNLFELMLRTIEGTTHGQPYDNLAEDEIEDILRQLGISNGEYVCLQLRNNICTFTGLAKGIEQSGERPSVYDTFEKFKNFNTHVLCVLYNIGLHWIATKVERTDYGLHFYIADSLCEADWLSDDLIKLRIKPLYDFLTTP